MSERIILDKSAENNSNPNTNINFNYENNYLVFAAKANLQEEFNTSKTKKELINKLSGGNENLEKAKLISKENFNNDHNYNHYDDRAINITGSNPLKLNLELDISRKAKSENLDENHLIPKNENSYAPAFVKSNNNNYINEENLREEDIIISEINENLKIPNANLKQISNHFLAKNEENSDKYESEEASFKIKRYSFKHNIKQNINSYEQQTAEKAEKLKNETNLTKFNSQNEQSCCKSNSISIFNSNNNSEKLFLGNKPFNNSNENDNKDNNYNVNNDNKMNNNSFMNGSHEEYENINFKKKIESKKIFDSGNTIKDKILKENNNNNNKNNIKAITKNSAIHNSAGSDVQFEYRRSKNFNGNFSNIFDLKGFNSAGIENPNIPKYNKSYSENIGSVRSKTVDLNKDDSGLASKRRNSLRQRETIIFNPEDILDFVHFKEWRKKAKVFFDRLKDLIVNFSSCLNTIDQSYSWIQKRFLKENLKRIKKSHKSKLEKSVFF